MKMDYFMKASAMKDRASRRIAASSLILAATLAGCSGVGLSSHVGNQPDQVERMAGAQAQEAEKALHARNATRAVEAAEAAVAADPDNAAWRSLLGRAYLLAGRYGSAQAAFQDALTLGNTDARTIVNLALVQTAQGQAESARGLLVDHMDHLSAADYGLAMAMAGDPDEAVRILSQAIHDPAATARERQNLAYAYALSGQWVEARQMATVDLPPLEAAKRVAGWAQMAQPGVESARVVAMIGVQPRGDDAGLPVRLALVTKPAGAPVQMAQADAAPAPAPAFADQPVVDSQQEAAQSMIAAASENNASEAPMPAPFEIAGNETNPVPVPMQRAKAVPVLRASIPVARPANRWVPVDPARGSAWVVQIGAFTSREAAQMSRVQIVRTNPALQAFPVIDSSVSIKGRSYYRVAVAGFSDRGGADRLCANIKAQGGNCFVRLGGPEAAPTRWAQALQRMKPQQMAMR